MSLVHIYIHPPGCRIRLVGDHVHVEICLDGDVILQACNHMVRASVDAEFFGSPCRQDQRDIRNDFLQFQDTCDFQHGGSG